MLCSFALNPGVRKLQVGMDTAVVYKIFEQKKGQKYGKITKSHQFIKKFIQIY